MIKISILMTALLLACQVTSDAEAATKSDAASEMLSSIEAAAPYYATIRTKYPETYAQIVATAERVGPNRNLSEFNKEAYEIVIGLVATKVPQLSAPSIASLLENSIAQNRFVAANHPSMCAKFASGLPPFGLIILPAELARKEAQLIDTILNDIGERRNQPMSASEFDDISIEMAVKAAKKLGISPQQYVAFLQQQGPDDMICLSQAELSQQILSLPREKRDSYLIYSVSP